MDINNMREFVANAYPGRSWHARVNIMSNSQVIAIYHSLHVRDKRKYDWAKAKKKKPTEPGYQITIFDVLKEDE